MNRLKLRITEAKLKEMDELIPLGKTDLGDLWDMRQDWVEMKKEVERLSDRLDAEIKFHENTCIKYYAERSDLREENERLKSAFRKLMDYHSDQKQSAESEMIEADEMLDQSWQDACEASIKTSRQSEVHLFRVMKELGMLDDEEIEFGALKHIKGEGTE